MKNLNVIETIVYWDIILIVAEAAPAVNEIGEVTIEDITEEENRHGVLEESEEFNAVEPANENQVMVCQILSAVRYKIVQLVDNINIISGCWKAYWIWKNKYIGF